MRRGNNRLERASSHGQAFSKKTTKNMAFYDECAMSSSRFAARHDNDHPA